MTFRIQYQYLNDKIFYIFQSNGMEQLRIEEELHRHSTTHNTIDRHYATDDTRVLMYELMKPSDPAVNRLSAPECGGLKKIPLSNSLTDLCEGMHVHAHFNFVLFYVSVILTKNSKIKYDNLLLQSEF